MCGSLPALTFCDSNLHTQQTGCNSYQYQPKTWDGLGGCEEEQVVCQLQRKPPPALHHPHPRAEFLPKSEGGLFLSPKDREGGCDHHIVYTCCAHGMAGGTP